MASPAPATPSFSTGTPGILNSNNIVTFTIPVFNNGTADAGQVVITNITLGSATRVGPILPMVRGTLYAGSFKLANAGFSMVGLNVGRSYLVTIKGTYQLGGLTYGFAVNRPIAIPTASTSELQLLPASIGVATNSAKKTWSYQILNNEPAGSPLYIGGVSISIDNTPFTVTGTPPGWMVATDNLTYVGWYANDPALPYPHQIAPGAMLLGFQIQSPQAIGSESTGLCINSWNHQTNKADLVGVKTTLTPSLIIESPLR